MIILSFPAAVQAELHGDQEMLQNVSAMISDMKNCFKKIVIVLLLHIERGGKQLAP